MIYPCGFTLKPLLELKPSPLGDNVHQLPRVLKDIHVVFWQLLYEALFEGVILFLILWFIVRPWKLKKKLPDGTVFAFYLMGYGFFRFMIEYCRQPDAEIGYVISLGKESDNIALFQSFLNISKGQVFCFIMIAAGAVLLAVLLWRYHCGYREEADRPEKRIKGKRT